MEVKSTPNNTEATEVKVPIANPDFQGLTEDLVNNDWYNEQFAGELGQKCNPEVLREASLSINKKYTNESTEPYIVHLFPLREHAANANQVKRLINSLVFGFQSNVVHEILEEKRVILILKYAKVANDILDLQQIRLVGWIATMPRFKCTKIVIIKNIGLNLDLEKLTEEIKANQDIPEVLEVSRMQHRVSAAKKSKSGLEPIDSLKVTFKGEQAPEKIMICGKPYEAAPFKVQLKRCTNCQKFGHYKKSCTKNPRCNYCSKNHLTSSCQNKKNLQCANCDGKHKANDTGKCWEYKKQNEIVKFMDEMQLSFNQAKDYYQDRCISEESDSSSYDSDNAAILLQMALLHEVMNDYEDEDDIFSFYGGYDSDIYDDYDFDDYDIVF